METESDIAKIDRHRFIKVLNALGGRAGNSKLRDTLGWDETRYQAARITLLDEGVIVAGRGRGGSVTLANAQTTATKPTRQRPEPGTAAPDSSPTTTGPRASTSSGNGANLDFEAKLWAAADKLRGNMEPSDYKHVAQGLIFLKYISDAFEAKRTELANEDLVT